MFSVLQIQIDCKNIYLELTCCLIQYLYHWNSAMVIPMMENLGILAYLICLIQEVRQNVPQVFHHMLHFPVNIKLYENGGRVLKVFASYSNIDFIDLFLNIQSRLVTLKNSLYKTYESLKYHRVFCFPVVIYGKGTDNGVIRPMRLTEEKTYNQFHPNTNYVIFKGMISM